MDHQTCDSASCRTYQRRRNLVAGRSSGLSTVGIRRDRSASTVAHKWIAPSGRLSRGSAEIADTIDRVENAAAERVDRRGVSEPRQDARAETSPVEVSKEEGLVAPIVNLRNHYRPAQGVAETVIRTGVLLRGVQ